MGLLVGSEFFKKNSAKNQKIIGDDKMVENRLVRFVEGSPRSIDLSYVKWRSC
ncbi:MAG: hypothetical protein HON47_05505 [Candidatus Diapherotrites archaeon]|uniref:Uncharacterized protein n=1 Tax=Candidatus Iainarchaeum sp. TaxID=3101447 RepID=A0A8T5GFT9_9ARCH|nr:hypothetical protein [Candidatus Diapherotrites archaeon]